MPILNYYVQSDKAQTSEPWNFVKKLDNEYNIRCMTAVQGISATNIWCGARDSSIHVKSSEVQVN